VGLPSPGCLSPFRRRSGPLSWRRAALGACGFARARAWGRVAPARGLPWLFAHPRCLVPPPAPRLPGLPALGPARLPLLGALPRPAPGPRSWWAAPSSSAPRSRRACALLVRPMRLAAGVMSLLLPPPRSRSPSGGRPSVACLGVIYPGSLPAPAFHTLSLAARSDRSRSPVAASRALAPAEARRSVVLVLAAVDAPRDAGLVPPMSRVHPGGPVFCPGVAGPPVPPRGACSAPSAFFCRPSHAAAAFVLPHAPGASLAPFSSPSRPFRPCGRALGFSLPALHRRCCPRWLPAPPCPLAPWGCPPLSQAPLPGGGAGCVVCSGRGCSLWCSPLPGRCLRAFALGLGRFPCGRGAPAAGGGLARCPFPAAPPAPPSALAVWARSGRPRLGPLLAGCAAGVLFAAFPGLPARALWFPLALGPLVSLSVRPRLLPGLRLPLATSPPARSLPFGVAPLWPRGACCFVVCHPAPVPSSRFWGSRPWPFSPWRSPWPVVPSRWSAAPPAALFSCRAPACGGPLRFCACASPPLAASRPWRACWWRWSACLVRLRAVRSWPPPPARPSPLLTLLSVAPAFRFVPRRLRACGALGPRVSPPRAAATLFWRLAFLPLAAWLVPRRAPAGPRGAHSRRWAPALGWCLRALAASGATPCAAAPALGPLALVGLGPLLGRFFRLAAFLLALRLRLPPCLLAVFGPLAFARVPPLFPRPGNSLAGLGASCGPAGCFGAISRSATVRLCVPTSSPHSPAGPHQAVQDWSDPRPVGRDNHLKPDPLSRGRGGCWSPWRAARSLGRLRLRTVKNALGYSAGGASAGFVFFAFPAFLSR